MTSTYYNTTSIKGSDLAAATKKCGRQEEYVLNIFKENNQLTSDDVYNVIRGRKRKELITEVKAMITSHTSAEKIIDHIDKQSRMIISIRRSITNLMNDGYLLKTDRKRRGLSGKKCMIYEYIRKP